MTRQNVLAQLLGLGLGGCGRGDRCIEMADVG